MRLGDLDCLKSAWSVKVSFTLASPASLRVSMPRALGALEYGILPWR